MPLILCSECNSQVSDTALKCTQCGFQLRKPQRSLLGKIFKWFFIFFNILMTLWLFSYWGSVGEMVGDATSSAEKTGAAIGTTIGTSMILGFWMFGDIILGLLVLFTRPKT